MRSRQATYTALLAVVILAFLVKLPYALRPFRLYSDAIAYVNIAHNWASGHGFASTLRLNYFDPAPVTHFALADWPPLYPFLCGVLMKAGVSDAGLQTVNAFLAALAAGLVFLIAWRVFDVRAALAAGIFAAFAVNLFRASLLAMSDALGLVLALSAVLAGLSAKGSWPKWLLAGMLAGAGYLVRFPNVVLMIAFVPYLLMQREERWNALACVAGFALAAGPVLAWKWVIYGSPVYGVQALHYATSSFRESSWQWHPANTAPPPIGDIAAAILRNARYFATNLFRTVTGLHVLTAGLPLALYAYRRDLFTRERVLLLAIAAMSFGLYTSTWSLPAAQGARFMLLSYCLLLPFCAAGLVWLLQRRKAVPVAVALAVSAFAIWSYCMDYPHSVERAAQFRPLDARVVSWARSSLRPGTIVASNNPWLVAHQTGFPTTALPHNLDARSLPEFVHAYRIRAFVIIKGNYQSLTLQTMAEHRYWFDTSDLGPVSVMIPISQFPIPTSHFPIPD